ncbi:arylsulfatase [Falsiruegeria mediterranea]|uniref:Arylsulfatase n=1 Tax=Falsiruegeria mediterranea M17 TaxID=1200281 RepID=A0A2R8CG30_9RHOB|nr:arylsulfatase [Falsiruegeria mediterranea]SPJ31381.1 Arylsulfatase [Falsiruegeria mediterranea M17]
MKFTLAATFAIAAAIPAMAQEAARPNILLVLLDDAGFMDFGAYGGDAATPNIDALADRGAMFSRFYMSPQCGPSRAMLMTGRDNHEVGLGSIPETLSPDMRQYPGYSMRWEDGLPTIASRLNEEGYQTFISGKWGIGDIGQNLPHRFGFDRSFVIDATGGSNYDHTPYVPLYNTTNWYEDGKPTTLPEGFYSSEGIVDRMINYLDEADPQKPFFSFLSFQAIHIPIQVAPEYRDRYAGRFDEGWEAMRKQRLERAVDLGLVPESTELAPLPASSRDWENLSPADQSYWARSMQVNAGMLEAADHHLGRLLAHLEAQGQLDNTLVIVTSDNGPESSGIGNAPGAEGVFQRWWMRQTGWNQDFETLGERNTMTFIGEEWASVSAAPFALFKFTATEGGLRVPLVIAGPDLPQTGILDGRAHVTDLVPTMLDIAGLDPVAPDIRGRSLLPMLSGARAAVYGDDEAVGFEVSGNAALYRGNWKISRIPTPLGDGKWHMYDLATDPGETTDLASARPELFQDMQNEYLSYADEVGVVPVPADYNPFKQIKKNVVSKMAREHWPGLLVAGLVLLTILFFSFRWVGRRLRP